MDALETEALLQPVLADLANVVHNITAAELSLPTPNTERDVAALRSHAVGWLTASAAGYNDSNGDVPMDDVEDLDVTDGRAQVEAAAESLDAAIQDGAAARPIRIHGSEMPGDMSLSMILWEYLVHGWDLAVATDQEWSPDPAAARAALAFAPGMLTPDFQGEGKAFGPPVEVSNDAGPFDQLLGLSGRDPAWTPPTS
jgi:uncharacterized protein (TIGR03086 family)